MLFDRSRIAARSLPVALLLFFGTYAAATDISTTPLSTYSVTSSTDVKPNIMFVLDDSGSMDWDFMPDWADSGNDYQFRNASFNGIAYNPAIRYTPPVLASSSGSTSTSYPSMTGAGTTSGANSSTKPNWNAVANDAYGVQSNTTSSLTPGTSFAPYFYTTIAGEYCNSASLRNCTTSGTATGAYTFPAPLRWCDSSALTNCKAGYDSDTSFTNARMPTPRTASFTISGSNSTSVTGITVDGLQIMAGTATAGGTPTTNTLAQNIASQINSCSYAITGNCGVFGYVAIRVNSTVTIFAPGTAASTTVVTKTGGMTVPVPNFSAGAVPGDNIRTTITPAVTSYPYPGTSTKAGARTDCAGTTCTYQEEMTNYANWWTYYRTRMQMMKTSASNAFSGIDTAADVSANKSRFRVGFMTINNNQSTDFVNLGEFTGTQKFTWYSKLINAYPSNNTPLRQALSDAGRIYAGVLTSKNGVTVTDPVQYSCQQNYTILSTDGFWNSNAGYKLDGTTPVGNQDAGQAAPYGDGGTSTQQIRTSTLQKATVTVTNQYRYSYLQTGTTTTSTAPSIQTRTSSDRGATWTAWSNVSSCTFDTSGSSRRDCQFPISTSSDSGTTWTPWAYASSCTPDNSGSSRTQCSGSITSTNWVNSNSCTTTTGIQCRYNMPTTSYTPTVGNSACVPVARSSGSPYTVGLAVECNNLSANGTYTNATSACTTSATTLCRYTAWSSWSNGTCTAAPQSTGPTYTQLVASQCQQTTTGGTSDTLADVAAYYYNTDLRTASPVSTADTTGTCTGPTGIDLCGDNVPSNGRDVAKTQHMTTFTLGLGAQGKMIYAPQKNNDYWQDTSGDFYDVLKRSTANTSTGVCSWLGSGLCYWPIPAADSNANIDDLWHAAINGHGTYFSAKDPSSLASGLNNVLAQIINTPRPGTAAAAASSNPNVTSSDNFVFSSSYESVLWTGELFRQQIDATGTLSNANWYASRLLDCATTMWAANTAWAVDAVFRNGTGCYKVKAAYTSGSTFDASSTGVDFLNTDVLHADEAASTLVAVVAKTSRTIFTNSSTALIPFTLTDLTNASLNGSFTESYLTPLLSQFCSSGSSCLSSANRTSASGANLVNYLRGDRTYENVYYRPRTHVLGDIVASEAKYVKAPLANYTDTGFAAYKTAQASRNGAVYVGANDGMLHAFEATSGQELWAYIPSKILPNLYKLADNNYAAQHQFFVDGTVEIGEVYGPCRPATTLHPTPCTGNEWRTVLIGGLNRGGTSYYALDVTDPADPIYLWELNVSSMGYTYGNPKITKLKTGAWVALLSSGYNNADGQGYLYTVNAIAGTIVRTIATSTVGEVARINARALSPDTDNTSIAAYGGDTAGNLWRFDINGDIGAGGYDAQKLVHLQDASGNAQPLTAQPELATLNGLTMVYVGTGRYLGVTDIADTHQQSFYGVVDRSDATTLPTPRSTGSLFVNQTLTDGTCPTGAPTTLCTPGQTVRTSTSNAVDWTLNNGWYVDFLGSGERSATDPSLALGSVLFTTIVPSLASANPCGDPSSAGGKSFLYSLDYKTGGVVPGTTGGVVGMSLGDILATRPVPIELPNGTIVTLTRGTPPAGSSTVPNATVNQPPINYNNTNGLRRVSWRELSTQ